MSGERAATPAVRPHVRPARSFQRGNRARGLNPTVAPRWLFGSFIGKTSYDAVAGVAEVFQPAACCVDMDDCIRFFEGVDPNVRLIRTFADGRLDTIYCKSGGDWEAMLPWEAHP